MEKKKKKTEVFCVAIVFYCFSYNILIFFANFVDHHDN